MDKLSPRDAIVAQYANESIKGKFALAQRIEKHSKNRLRFQYLGYEQLQLPVFIDRESGILFKYVPGGTYKMGLSDVEEAAANQIAQTPPISVEEMRPVKNENVRPMFVSVMPILWREVRILDKKSSRPKCNLNYPARVTNSIAKAICQEIGGRLPMEAEWEYICRGATATLFCFGNSLPHEEDLAKWLVNDFSGVRPVNHNAFGLFGLFGGEWCADSWSPSYACARDQQSDAFVVRGGGSYFWPWQDLEWVWCMSAMRMPSSNLDEPHCCGFRIVIELEM